MAAIFLFLLFRLDNSTSNMVGLAYFFEDEALILKYRRSWNAHYPHGRGTQTASSWNEYYLLQIPKDKHLTDSNLSPTTRYKGIQQNFQLPPTSVAHIQDSPVREHININPPYSGE